MRSFPKAALVPTILGLLALAAYACVGDDPGTATGGVEDDAAGGENEEAGTQADGDPCEGRDLQSDPANCGACGKTCAAGFECTSGVCGNAVAFVASGENHSCAVLRRGDLYCWGSNVEAQSGADASASVPPTLIPRDNTLATLPPLTSLGLGLEHSCGLRPDGIAVCWGSGRYGQLSNGQTGVDGGSLQQPIPRNASMASSILPGSPQFRYTRLAQGASALHGCALTTDAGVACWGWNDSAGANHDTSADEPCGERNTFACINRPQAVAVDPAQAVAVARDNTCTVNADGGGVRCWGANRFGQLGDGTRTIICFPDPCERPVTVTGLPLPAKTVALGDSTACVLLEDKSVWCWGRNTNDQLGFPHGQDAGDQCCNIEGGCNGGQYCRPTPIKVSGVTNAVDVGVGGSHVCALLEDGSVVCWGANDRGQLGNGQTNAGSATPQKVVDLPPAAGIAVGGSHTCAWTTDGRVFCWGLNANGQLGSGTANSNKPVLVQGLP